MTYATTSATFQLQMSRHQSATEWLLNSTYRHFQDNHVIYAQITQTVLTAGSQALSIAAQTTRFVVNLLRVTVICLAVICIATITFTVIAVHRLNKWVDSQVDESIPTEEVEWADALRESATRLIDTWIDAWVIAVAAEALYSFNLFQ